MERRWRYTGCVMELRAGIPPKAMTVGLMQDKDREAVSEVVATALA
jgi:hypothetical protein